MCFKIPANSEKDVREQVLSSDKAAECARREDFHSAPAAEATSDSGVMAMFRRLFASFNEKAAARRLHEETGSSMTDERREVEKVH
jgi:hypothetical protein